MDISREEVIKKLRIFFGENQELLVVYLFGSYAKETPKNKMDIDVAILLEDFTKEKAVEQWLRYKEVLQRNFHKEVDLILLNSVDPIVKQQIFFYGIKIGVRDRNKFLDFRVKSYHEYFDMIHIQQKIFDIQKEKINRRVEKDGR